MAAVSGSVSSSRVRAERDTAATARRRLLADRAARGLVTAGGVAIIAGILGILVFIVAEVLPLASSAKVTPGQTLTLRDAALGALVGDEYRTHVVTFGLDGRVRAFRTADGRLVWERSALRAAGGPAAAADDTRILLAHAPPGSRLLSGSTSDGRIVVVPVEWKIAFEDQQRVITPALGPVTILDADPARRPLRTCAAELAEDGRITAAAQLADGTLAVIRREATENPFTGEVTESTARHVQPLLHGLNHLVLDRDQRNLYGATADGDVLWWPLEGGVPGAPQAASAGSPVTALSLLIGDRALVVGQADGSLSIWFQVRQPDQSVRLARVRDFPAHPGAIRLIAPSPRERSFLAQDARGRLGLYYSTSARVLWVGDSPLPDAGAAAYAPKADGAYLAERERLTMLEVDNPHPEVSLRSLFGRVWYEGYGKPAYVWQSSGGTDEFEPKLSLTPLLHGTIKGTVYSLLLAIPLGVFGAMYTSQFMHPSLRRYVKPAVEIMAALPSVVLGFLAGLWLAPRVEASFPALLLMVATFPVLVLAAGALWERLPARVRHVAPGIEVVWLVAVLAAGLWLCLELSRPFEALAFGGNFQSWLSATTGLAYDQRNAIVVGLAMGFAVIPIIFAISEDAFSNVPGTLISGSLALGASRWQTVTRVVLPTASPGIFSAIMIGFGRAVGETMIVLMATGNTPIMDWNLFNGFRTLSANIAVEIPEAPQHGTLYRVLFLAALVLFVMTFIINTLAEVVRQRLRRRYAEL